VTIKSIRDRETAKIFRGRFSKRFPPEIQARAYNLLGLLDSATSLNDLSAPGLRFEALRGERKGELSVRINRQWRICFLWIDGEPQEVEITDYH